MDAQGALDVVFQALDVVNGLRSADDQIPKQSDLRLAGSQGRLDSLSLVTLVVAIERRIGEVSGRELTLLDGDAESGLDALRTPASIADLIVRKLNS